MNSSSRGCKQYTVERERQEKTDFLAQLEMIERNDLVNIKSMLIQRRSTFKIILRILML